MGQFPTVDSLESYPDSSGLIKRKNPVQQWSMAITDPDWASVLGGPTMDEAMVGFNDAARRWDISRAMPTGQGMQLPAAVAHYSNFLGAIDYADQWCHVEHPAGALHALRESAERFVRGC